MELAYFSNIRNEIMPYIDKATKKIQVAMAWFTSSELFNALLEALDRGVGVELVLLDNTINFMYYAPDFNEFINHGGKLRIAGANIGFMHHKFCVIDDKVAITGSYNWTYYAESRNIENVVISDNKDLVRLFVSEFQRLKNELSLSHSCIRLSWDDIEIRDDVDYRELNYEIERISEVQNKPIRRFFETKTEVIRTEIKKSSLSKYTIGILAIDDRGNESLQGFINCEERLPYTSDTLEFFFDSKNETEFKCKFIYENPKDKADRGLVKEVDLMQVAQGSCEEDLPINFTMHLDDNGSLRVDVVCVKSGHMLTVSALNSSFVKYE